MENVEQFSNRYKSEEITVVTIFRQPFSRRLFRNCGYINLELGFPVHSSEGNNMTLPSVLCVMPRSPLFSGFMLSRQS